MGRFRRGAFAKVGLSQLLSPGWLVSRVGDGGVLVVEFDLVDVALGGRFFLPPEVTSWCGKRLQSLGAF